MADIIDILKIELALSAYDGTTDEQAAGILNDDGGGSVLLLDTLTAADIYELVATAEFDSLSVDNKAAVDRILGLGGDISIGDTSKAKAVLMAAFGNGTATRAAIGAKVSRAVSRGVFLGIGFVKVGNVEEARI